MERRNWKCFKIKFGLFEIRAKNGASTKFCVHLLFSPTYNIKSKIKSNAKNTAFILDK